MRRTSLRAPGAMRIAGASLVTALTIAAVAPAAVASDTSAAARSAATSATPGAATEGMRLARLVRAAMARRGGGAPRAAAALTTGSLSIPDPLGDASVASEIRADITDAGLAYGAGSVRVAAKLHTGTDPTSDANWRSGATGLVWVLDTNNDNQPDYGAVLLADADGRLLGAVVTNVASQSPVLRCLAAGAWDGNRTYSLAFPAACIGTPASVAFGADMTYDTTHGVATSPPEDVAPDSLPLAGPVAPSAVATPDAGGLVVDGFGGLHFFGLGSHRHAPRILDGPYWSGWDIVRGVAMFPGGGHGYVLDGKGGLHGFSLSPNQIPRRPPDSPYWSNLDIARGVALYPDGRSGVVVDGFGGLHPFSIGTHHATPVLSGAPYWNGWDIARGVAVLPDGTGGFVLDGFGGLHFFSIGARRSAPAVFDAPYWPTWAIARGVTLLPDGTGGYVVDARGGLHFFSIGTRRSAPVVSGAPYWPTWDIARGAAVIPGPLALP